MKRTLIVVVSAGLIFSFATTLHAQRGQKLSVIATPALHLSPEIQMLKNKAFEGDAKAQFKLGFLYETGKGGLTKDFSYAMSWYEEAARNGSQAASKKLKSL